MFWNRITVLESRLEELTNKHNECILSLENKNNAKTTQISELSAKIKRICKHENQSVSRVVNTTDEMFNPYTVFNKTCKDCGSMTRISPKEYLTYQKETIESSLKELE